MLSANASKMIALVGAVGEKLIDGSAVNDNFLPSLSIDLSKLTSLKFL
jgi:hypothetical protein